MTGPTIVWRGAVLVALLATAACGATTSTQVTEAGGNPPAVSSSVGNGSSAPAAKAPDPCTLITDDEAASLLGGPATHTPGAPRNASDGGLTVTENLCAFRLVTSDQSGHEIQVADYAGADRNFFNQKASGQPVSGLGDAATGDTIHVYVFSKGVMLQVYGSLGAEDGLQQAARFAIARL